MEQLANEDTIETRLSSWPMDRLIEEGYCFADMTGFWLDATQFGRPVAAFSLGPGIHLPWNRFESVQHKLTASQQLIFIYISTRNGNQVRVSLKDPRSDDAITASVVSKTASQIRLVFDRRFPLSDDVWR